MVWQFLYQMGDEWHMKESNNNTWKEGFFYLVFGGLTTLVSIASYVIFLKILDGNALLANVISWIFAVSFAYITNRIWVFRSPRHGFREILKEIVTFYLGRVATLLMEELILFVGINMLGIDKLVIKLIAQVMVLVGNYTISKFVVFHHR